MKIKAHAIKKSGGKAEPFYYEKAIDKNDVLVRITFCSITRGDIQIIDNDWGDTKFPVVAGHEIMGTVEDTGPGVTSLTSGDRVGVGYREVPNIEPFSGRFERIQDLPQKNSRL